MFGSVTDRTVATRLEQNVASRRRLIAGGAIGITGLLAACAQGREPASGSPTTFTRKAKIAVSFPAGPPEQTQVLNARARVFQEKYPSIEVEEISGAGGALNEKV